MTKATIFSSFPPVASYPERFGQPKPKELRVRPNPNLEHPCIDCNQRERAPHSTSRCEVCLKKLRERASARYYARKEEGVCVQCGGSTDGYGEKTIYCKACLKKYWRRMKKRKEQKGRKEGGLYYTPEYIVRYITEQTVGKLMEGKKPAEIAKITVCDPASGAGAFLLGAYEAVLNYHIKYYNEPANYDEGLAAGCVANDDGKLKLSFEQKKQILLNNIYGVDINEKAVRLAKLTLYLRLIEGEEGVNFPPEYAWDIAVKSDAYIAGQADKDFEKKIGEAIGALHRFIGFDEKGHPVK